MARRSNYLKDLMQLRIVKNLVVCATIFAAMNSYGISSRAGEIPVGWESYLGRPDILTLPEESKEQDPSWGALKAAHFSFIAELLALYPSNADLYFLARDSEHLYDVARLVTEGSPDASRIHLLNVSRGNMRADGIKDYLRENGISEESLKTEKMIIFIDTGFTGTIPMVIGELFPEESRKKMKTHLVVSSNYQHPSSRAFLFHLNPQVNGQNPSSMHGTIVSYEHMSRFTDRSSQFVEIAGRYHPISPIGQSTDGSVSKKQALIFMKDLKAEWAKPETKARFYSELEQFRHVRMLLENGSTEAKSELRAELKKSGFYEAQVRDAIDALPNAGSLSNVSLDQLGLKQGGDDRLQFGQKELPKKLQLIQQFPDWAPLLQNPEDMIPKLFAAENWQMIGNLIDADVDQEINKILMTNLFKQPFTAKKKDFVIAMIEIGNKKTLENLCFHVFSNPEFGDLTEIIKIFIEHANDDALQALAFSAFSKPHAVAMEGLMQLAISKAGGSTLHTFATDVLSKPHTKNMRSLFQMLIDKNDEWTNKYLIGHAFREAHTADKLDFLRVLVESPFADKYVYDTQVLSKEHAKAPEYKIFSEALSIGDLDERKHFIDSRLRSLQKAKVPARHLKCVDIFKKAG